MVSLDVIRWVESCESSVLARPQGETELARDYPDGLGLQVEVNEPRNLGEILADPESREKIKAYVEHFGALVFRVMGKVDFPESARLQPVRSHDQKASIPFHYDLAKTDIPFEAGSYLDESNWSKGLQGLYHPPSSAPCSADTLLAHRSDVATAMKEVERRNHEISQAFRKWVDTQAPDLPPDERDIMAWTFLWGWNHLIATQSPKVRKGIQRLTQDILQTTQNCVRVEWDKLSGKRGERSALMIWSSTDADGRRTLVHARDNQGRIMKPEQTVLRRTDTLFAG